MFSKSIRIFFLFLCTAVFSFPLTLKELVTIKGAGAPKAVEVSPNGEYVAVANLEGMSVWMVSTKTLEKIRSIDFAPYRTRATGHNYSTHKPITSWAEKPVECAFSENGRYIWTSFHNGKCVVRYDTLEEEKVEYSLPRRATVTATGGLIVRKEAKSSSPILTKMPPGASLTVLREDGPSITVENIMGRWYKVQFGSYEGWAFGGYISDNESIQKTRIHNYETDKNYTINIRKVMVGNTPKVVAVTPNDKYALVANWFSRSISVIDANTVEKLSDIPTAPKGVYVIPRGIAISTNSKTAFVANMGGGTIAVISLETMSLLENLKVTPNPRHIVLSKDGDTMYISENRGGEVVKYSLSAKKIVDRKKIGSQARTIAVSPDEKYIFVAAHESDKIVSLSASNLEVVGEVSIYHPMGLSVSPDGKQLWATSYQGMYVRAYSIEE